MIIKMNSDSNLEKEEKEKIFLKDIIMSYKSNEYLFKDNFEKFYQLTKKITLKRNCMLCNKSINKTDLPYIIRKALFNRYSN